jgi:hypothetical protein
MKRWVPVLGVFALLALVWLASTLSSPEVTQLPLLDRTPQPEPSTSSRSGGPGPGQGIAGDRLPEWVSYAFLALIGLVILFFLGIVVALLVSMLRGMSPMKQSRLIVQRGDRKLNPRGDEAEVLAAVDAGLTELSDTDVDPRRAVIACWVRLEGAAAGAGTPREIGDSPTDLVTRLLSAHRVSRPVLDGFAAVYREARYATHPIDERARQTALAALRQLRHELAAEVPDA